MKKLIKAGILTMATVMAGTSYADTNEDIIKAKYKLSEQAFSDNNVQILLDKFYARDIYVVGEGSPALSGSKELAPVLKSLVEGAYKIELSSERANYTSNDIIYDFVNYHVFPADGSESFNVRSLLVWEKIEGDWRVSADMYTFGEYK